jgi:F-type H+-transporting ATPase subunit epsilon
VTVHVKIVTPLSVAYEGDCDMAAAPGQLGEFGVLNMHAQTLAVTEAGVVTLVSGSDVTKFVVGPGFAEVGPDRITLLVDLCESAEDVDKATATTELNEAFASLKNCDTESEEGLRVRRQANLAQARLRA